MRLLITLSSFALVFPGLHTSARRLPKFLALTGGSTTCPHDRFTSAAYSIRRNGHPDDCPHLRAFEDAVYASDPEDEIVSKWINVRIAACATVKSDAKRYEDALLVVAIEALAYSDLGKLAPKAVAEIHGVLARKIGVDTAEFGEKLTRFEESMKTQATAISKTMSALVLQVLKDPDFVPKALHSMAKRKSRAIDFLRSEEVIEKTRVEFLTALEAAAENGPIYAGQLAQKIKPSLEILLGPNMGLERGLEAV